MPTKQEILTDCLIDIIDHPDGYPDYALKFRCKMGTGQITSISIRVLPPTK